MSSPNRMKYKGKHNRDFESNPQFYEKNIILKDLELSVQQLNIQYLEKVKFLFFFKIRLKKKKI